MLRLRRQRPTVSAASRCTRRHRPKPPPPSVAFQKPVEPSLFQKTDLPVAKILERFRMRHITLPRPAVSSQLSLQLQQPSQTLCRLRQVSRRSSRRPRHKLQGSLSRLATVPASVSERLTQPARKPNSQLLQKPVLPQQEVFQSTSLLVFA